MLASVPRCSASVCEQHVRGIFEYEFPSRTQCFIFIHAYFLIANIAPTEATYMSKKSDHIFIIINNDPGRSYSLM